ncbi:MAG: FecR domain-containing protein [Cyclobacteriaceae bacterium]|nr:FecR domain-containing protein [Cyclobacteriaceae bacterium]
MEKDKSHIFDLLSNKTFVEWVRNPNKQSDEFWERWLEGHASRKQDFYIAIKIIQSISFKDWDETDDNSRKILTRIINEEYSSTYTTDKAVLGIGKKIDFLTWSVKIAAVISFFVTFSFLAWYFQEEHKEEGVKPVSLIQKNTERRQKISIYLPDSSRVTLNSESFLEYPQSFGNERLIFLKGEAFFEVKDDPERPFIVRSGDLSTTALGTSFNVKAYPEEQSISVSLASGKVITETGSRLIELTPGEKTILHTRTGLIEKVKFQIETDLAWKDGILIFEKSDLKEFVHTIERWYDVGVEIQGTPSEHWRISGSFDNETLKNVLESLSFARKIDYSLRGNNVILKF